MLDDKTVFTTLRKGHMKRYTVLMTYQEGVYDTLDEVYGTVEGCL